MDNRAPTFTVAVHAVGASGGGDRGMVLVIRHVLPFRMAEADVGLGQPVQPSHLNIDRWAGGGVSPKVSPRCLFVSGTEDHAVRFDLDDKPFSQ